MAGRITGNVRVEERKKGRVWVAAYQLADGSKTRKTLGNAWVKDSGRRTARGAVAWRAANGSKPDATYLTPGEAQAKLEELLAAERAKPAVRGRVRGKTLGDAGEAYLREREGRGGVAPTTLRGYRVMVGLLESDFGRDTLLVKITSARISRYQDELLAGRPGERKLTRKTVRNRMLVLRGIFDCAKEQGWVAVSPMADVRIVAQPGAEPDFNVLEPGQVEAVAAAMLVIRDEDLPRMRNGEVDQHSVAIMHERRALWSEAVRLAAYTGLRFGELRALHWRDVDLEGRNVHVRRNAPTSAPAGAKSKAPKSKRGRAVPLIDQGVEALERVRAGGYPSGANDLVLPSRGGGMLDPGRVRDAFYAGLRDAGLGYMREKDNPMTLHDLRHTFGTLAVRKLPVTDVQAYLGHADIATTMRYVHHIPRTDAARKLSEAFAGGD